MRWIGQRSYGLYLWHWPVFILVVAALPGWARDGWQGWALGGIALAITVAAAALSYELVEQPIRRDGFRATLAPFGAIVPRLASRVRRVGLGGPADDHGRASAPPAP